MSEDNDNEHERDTGPSHGPNNPLVLKCIDCKRLYHPDNNGCPYCKALGLMVEKKSNTGGYCPKCDTVWASPGKCDCETFDSSDANMGKTKKGYAVPNDSVYTKEIWNASIEAAADMAKYNAVTAEEIRSLKK
jgi:Zn-finger nucleic acid-binding protein